MSEVMDNLFNTEIAISNLKKKKSPLAHVSWHFTYLCADNIFQSFSIFHHYIHSYKAKFWGESYIFEF